MKQKLKITPFKPYVTLEKIQNFDPARPETHTASPLVNAVCELLYINPHIRPSEMATCLALDRKHLSCALQVACGYTAEDLRIELLLKLCRNYMEKNPDWMMRDLMPIVGLRNPTSMSRFVKSNKHRCPELRKFELRRLNQEEEIKRRRATFKP